MRNATLRAMTLFPASALVNQSCSLRAAAHPSLQPPGQGCAFARQTCPLIAKRRAFFSFSQLHEASGLLTMAADARL
jgi:hypothetical protein